MVVDIIVILLVFAGVNGMLILLMTKISDKINREVKSVLMKELSVYDRIIDGKLQEIYLLKEEEREFLEKEQGKITATRADKPALSVYSGTIGKYTASYQDGNFRNNYCKLREELALNYGDIVREFIRNLSETDSVEGALYLSIQDKLPYSVLYYLTILDEAEQKEKLLSYLTEEETMIVDLFMQEAEEFKILAFKEFIDEKLRSLDDALVVLIPREIKDLDKIDKRVKIQVDLSMIEGMRILHRNKLYDYSF